MCRCVCVRGRALGGVAMKENLFGGARVWERSSLSDCPSLSVSLPELLLPSVRFSLRNSQVSGNSPAAVLHRFIKLKCCLNACLYARAHTRARVR